MPKYFPFKIAGYYLYFTMACVVECIHAHASDTKLTEAGAAKLFIKSDGDTIVQKRGTLSDKELATIQKPASFKALIALFKLATETTGT